MSFCILAMNIVVPVFKLEEVGSPLLFFVFSAGVLAAGEDMAVKTVICFYLFCLWLQVQAQQGVVLTSSSGEPCFGQAVTLTCTHPDPFQDSAKYQPEFSAWTENGTRLDFTLPATLDRFTHRRLNHTASTLSFAVTEEYLANRVVIFSCFLVLTGGGGRQESNRITIDVKARPPTLVSKPNSTSGLLQWNSPSSNCSNYQYIFTLTWVRIGDGSTGTVSTTENRYNLTGGNYTVNITAKIVGLNLKESEPLSVKLTVPVTVTTDQSTEDRGDRTGIYIGAGAAGAVFLILILVAIGVIGVICYCRSKKKRVSQSSHTDPESCKPPNKKQEAEMELDQTRQELDRKQETENQVQYAAIDFSGQRPIAPPSLETVVYTETVEQFRNARKNCPIPPLPPVKTEEEVEEERKLAQEALQQIQYAAIDFSGQRPIAPPSLETVVYTETVEQFRNARKNRPIPPLPPVKTEEEEEEEKKQLAQEALQQIQYAHCKK